MTRSTAKICAAALFGLSFVLGVVARAHAGDDGKCTIATNPETALGKICASGGRGAAKKEMKAMVKQAKASGQKFTCEGCHKDLDNFALTKDATDEYKKLEAVVAKK